MDSKITTKGQVTIPKAMREYLNLEAGDKVEFVYLEDGGVRIEPARKRAPRKAATGRFAALRGRIKGGPRTDELMQLLRGYADDAKDPGFRK